MKKLIVVAVALVMVMGLVGGASAANSLREGTKGFSVGFGNSIAGETGFIDLSGRYLISNDMALLAGFGYESHSGDADGSYMSLALGIRSYLKNDDFAPFIQGKFRFETQDIAGDTDAFDFSLGFGGEYFLNKQFSVEGNVGVGFGVLSNNTTNLDDVYFGTRTVGVSANFYF
jgi:hypothetical protein